MTCVMFFSIVATEAYEFEILDVSGNRPLLRIKGTSTTVQHAWNEARNIVTLTMKKSGEEREVIAKVMFQGVVTEPDVVKGNSCLS